MNIKECKRYMEICEHELKLAVENWESDPDDGMLEIVSQLEKKYDDAVYEYYKLRKEFLTL